MGSGGRQDGKKTCLFAAKRGEKWIGMPMSFRSLQKFNKNSTTTIYKTIAKNKKSCRESGGQEEF